MSRPVKVSVAQLPAKPQGRTCEEKKQANLSNIVAYLREAGERGSDVAVFGEIANIAGIAFNRENLERYSDPVPGPFPDEISHLAREFSMNIVAPIAAEVDGRLRNATLIVDREGHHVGTYLKTHLPAPELDAGIVPGEGLPVFTLDFGRIGVMTCMDIEYPEVALCLMLQGAEIIFFPHVQSGWGEVDWEARYRSRAIDTGTYVVSASFGTGDREAWRPGMMLGRSGIVGPDGMILAQASRGAELVTREIDLDRKRLTDFHFARLCERSLAVRASRRPELYSLLCDVTSRDEAVAQAAKAVEELEAARKAGSSGGG